MPCAKNRARDKLSFLKISVQCLSCIVFVGASIIKRLHKVFPDAAWFINLAFLTGRQEAVVIAGPFRLFSKPTVSC